MRNGGSQTMRIPSKIECFQLMTQMRMLDHIAAHSLMVSRVALLLTDRLIRQGASVHRGLVATAALLHDITKPRSLTTGENHAETGGELLRDLGFPELGRIVAQHVLLERDSTARFPTEAEIVNYADKRVLHDRIVSLDERMAYILERYGDTPEYRARLRWLWDISNLQEKRIFAEMPFSPAGIELHMEKVDLAVELQKVLVPIEPLV
jgi:putative nucleotidyltransferase with HDIG domain